MNGNGKLSWVLGLAAAAGIASSSALGADCSDVVPGARLGPHPDYLTWPYGSDACYVSWPGGGGASARSSYEARCHALDAEFIDFQGDSGSNRNTCIFRKLGSSTPTKPDTEEEPEDPEDEVKPPSSSPRRSTIPPTPPMPSPVRPAPPSVAYDPTQPYYTFQVCNYANDGKASVALIINEDPRNKISVLRAWYGVEQGSCRDIESRNFEGRSWIEILVHAHTHNHHWPAKSQTYTKRCVSNKKTGRTITEGYNCQENEKQRNFSRVVINKGDDLQTRYKYTLSP